MSKTKEAALEYEQRGWTIVGLRRGSKNPDSNTWTEGTPASALRPDDNIGVLLGAPPSMLVDVDLDCKEALIGAPWLLPKTDCRFGRESRPESHWVYQSTQTIRRIQYKNPRTKELMLEIRGEGHQTMFPPSLHPSGERVQWASDGPPALCEDFEALGGPLAAACLIAQLWPDWRHSHHIFVLHLSGALLNADWPVHRIEEFVSTICRMAGDHEPEDRLGAVRSTAKRKDEGETYTGWPSLVEFLHEEESTALKLWLQINTSHETWANTDEGNAQRLAYYFGKDIRFCPEHGAWYIWNGRFWGRDVSGRIVHLMREVLVKIQDEARQQPTAERRDSLMRWSLASASVARMYAAPKLASTLPSLLVPADQLDVNPYLLNVSNGTVNLETGGLQPHNPNDFITKIAPVRFDANAEHPLWDAYLDLVQPDLDTRAYIQRACGYSISGSNIEQVFFILHGPKFNGKTTFLNTMRNLLGDYVSSADPSTFMRNHNQSIRSDQARLQGSRLVLTSEGEESDKLAEAYIKRVTGGDAIVARALYSKEVEHIATYKIWMITNHLPRVNALDEALWRRLRLLPFPVIIPAEKQVKNYENILKEELPGILNWFIQGHKMWREEGLGAPSFKMTEAATAYQALSDSVGRFVIDECALSPTSEIGAGMLYTLYKSWCDTNNERPLSGAAFKERILQRGLEQRRSAKGLVWIGITHEMVSGNALAATGNLFGGGTAE